MYYHDFEIRIRSDGQGGFVAEVLRAPYARRIAAPFYPPFSVATVPAVMEELEWRIRNSARGRGETRELDLVTGPEVREIVEASPESLGVVLFRSLFSGTVAEVFQQSLAHVRGRGGEEGLRLRLSFDLDDESIVPLAAIPWELLVQMEFKEFFGRQRHTIVVRDLPLRRLLRPLEIESPLRILVADSCPTELPSLDLAEEGRRIKEALAELSFVEVSFLDCPTLESLRDALLDGHFHVLHFMGHGGFEPENGEGVLFFENRAGQSFPVSGTMIGETVKGIDTLQLVFLNACYAGAFPRRCGQDPYTAVAPAVLLAGVPAVIAMQFPISDQAGIAFSSRFYSRLASGDAIDSAVAEGRLSIHLNDMRSLEWATPVLFLNSGDGNIAILKERKQNKPLPLGTLKVQLPLRLGIRSFIRWGREMDNEAEQVLDLTRYFEGPTKRNVWDVAFWHTAIFPQLQRFLEAAAIGRRPMVIDFAAHASIAFAAGYCLEARSGIDVTLRQRTQTGTVEWRALDGSLREGPLWLEEPDRVRDVEACDVAVGLEVTDVLVDDIEIYLERTGLAMSRIIHASVAPCPSTTAVRDGGHALHIAQSLCTKLKKRTAREREGTLHIFAAAPNTVMFFLGQLSRRLGRIQLYEYDLEAGRPGAYSPSIQLPPDVQMDGRYALGSVREEAPREPGG